MRTLVIAATLSAIALGCSSGPKTRPGDGTPDSGNSGVPAEAAQNGASEQYGPPTPEDQQPPIAYGPEPIQLKPVTLVFGPGMARSFAQVGVLRSFVENKIPINAIYGMEMGSLVAALYASDSNLNHFEWSLLRLKDDLFLSRQSLLGNFFRKSGNQLRGDPEKLEDQLRQIFGNHDISEARIPLRIALLPKRASSPVLLDKGALAPTLRVAVAGPGFFGPGTFEGQPARAASGAANVTFLCTEARAKFGPPVVLVDTGATASDPSAADLVIRPRLAGIGPADFQKRTDAAFRGKKAVEERLPELRRWVGLPEELNKKEGVSQ